MAPIVVDLAPGLAAIPAAIFGQLTVIAYPSGRAQTFPDPRRDDFFATYPGG